MQKESKTLIFLIGLLLIVGLLGEFLFYLDITQFGTVTQTGTAIGRLGGLILLFRQGTLTKSRSFFQLTVVLLGLTVLGAIMKIMHWPFANLILLIGLIGIPTIYSFHFFKKAKKHRLDILKFCWVTVCYVSAIFLIQHFPFRYELQTIEGVLFLIMFTDFAYGQYRTDRQSTNEDTING
ncbi:MAG: hypothetical protein V4615_15665 [Bacteroidota bacterium]